MSQRIIADRKNITGLINNGELVEHLGEPFKVIDAFYQDEKGEGVLLETIYNEKVVNFELEKIELKWKREGRAYGKN